MNINQAIINYSKQLEKINDNYKVSYIEAQTIIMHALNISKIKLISEGKINTDFLITHRVKLDDILKGYEIFDKKEDNCIKIAIENIN